MDILTNSTKLTEVENNALDSIEVAIWIIAGLAICAFLVCIKQFLDSILYVLSCIYSIICCKCCRSSNDNFNRLP